MKGFSKRFLVNISVIGLFIVQIGVNIISYLETTNLFDAFKWVSHTHEVLYSVNNLWLNEMNLENEVHDYLLTQNPDYLKKYETLKKTIEKQLKSIQHQTKDNIQQVNNINALTALFTTQIAHFDELIQQKKQWTPEEIITKLNNNNHASKIYSITLTMLNSEQTLLKERQQSAFEYNYLSNSYLRNTFLLNIALVILFILIFNQQYSKAVLINRRRRVAENQLKGIIQGTNDAIAAIDTQFNLIIFNKTFEQEYVNRYGKPVNIGDNIKEYLYNLSDDANLIISYWEKALQGQEFKVIHEVTIRSHISSYEITFNPIYDKNQVLMGAAKISRNITEQLKMEQKMQKTNDNLAQSINAIQAQNSSIFSLNLLGSTLQSCLTIEETFDPIATYGPKVLFNTAGVLYMAHPSRNYLDLAICWNNPKVQENIIAPEHCWALRRGQPHMFYNEKSSVPCDHIKNTTNPPPAICLPLQAQNDIVGLIYIEFNLKKEVTEEEFNTIVKGQELLIHSFAEAIALSLANIKLRDTLHRRSIRDPLTGMYNRSYLDESFNREIQRTKRTNNNMAVVMMDVDYFKKINDSFGHDAGDSVLVKISNIILNFLRQSDIACRYGGEEILLLLFEINSPKEVERHINELRTIISQTEFLHQGKSLGTVTASFGIACLSDFSEPFDLISEADQALYVSKKNGRNRVTMAAGTSS